MNYRMLLHCGLLIAAGITSAVSAQSSKPNILVILADDLGYSDLGCYGGEIDTPNLNKLADEGLRFTQFYNSARCVTTRTAFITGYQYDQVVPRPKWALGFPRLLKPLGYRSYHSGKWHVRGWRKVCSDAGFDRSYHMADSNRFFGPQALFFEDQRVPTEQPLADDYYATTEIATQAIEQLKDHAAKHSDQPFFQYLAFTSPHFPLHGLQEDIDKYRERYRDGWDALRLERMQRRKELGFADTSLAEPEPQIIAPSGKPSRMKILGSGEIDHYLPWAELTDAQKEFQATKMSIHAAMVDRMDQEIGRVIDQLEDMGELENTVIFFFTDNGASAEILVRGDGHDRDAEPGSAASYLCLGPGWSTAANTPMRRHKIWTHEGGVATPLIVHWPEGIAEQGTFRHQPAHVVDFAPSLLELAGARLEPDASCGPGAPAYPGRSLLPSIKDNQAIDRDFIYFSHVGNRGLRIGDWKVVSSVVDDNVWALYDLSADRGETNDLSEQYPERLQEMTRLWEATDQLYRSQAGPKRK